MKEVLVDPRVVEYLQIHRHEEVLYLNKEQLERLVSALLLAVIIQLKAKEQAERHDRSDSIADGAADPECGGSSRISGRSNVEGVGGVGGNATELKGRYTPK